MLASLLLVPLLLVDRAWSEDRTAPADASCRVTVRAVAGTERYAELSSHHLELDDSIKDIRDQLEPLPYSRYRSLERKERRLGFEELGTFAFRGETGGAHRLSVVPHQVSAGWVHSTLNWFGPDGEELLSTKLRVLDGKSVIVGTDSGPDGSTILCVRMECGQGDR